MPRERGQKMKRPERMELVRQALQLDEQGLSQRQIAERLDLSRGTISLWMRKHGPSPQRRIAQAIRRELVCCDIYQRMEDVGGDTEAWKVLRDSVNYHPICFFGEWAARIAEKVDVRS